MHVGLAIEIVDMQDQLNPTHLDKICIYWKINVFLNLQTNNTLLSECCIRGIPNTQYSSRVSSLSITVLQITNTSHRKEFRNPVNNPAEMWQNLLIRGCFRVDWRLQAKELSRFSGFWDLKNWGVSFQTKAIFNKMVKVDSEEVHVLSNSKIGYFVFLNGV